MERGCAVSVMPVKLRIDPTGWNPPPDGKAPGYWWQLVVEGDGAISFDVKGMQMAESALEQLSAQAWDDELMAQFGDHLLQVNNEALLVSGSERAAVEAEALRQLELVKVKRYRASVTLGGQDLRLLPGDCLQTPHPRDDYEVLVWAHQVTHFWEVREGGRTSVAGYVVGTVGGG